MPPKPSLKDPRILVATWFGSGYLPLLPGTWGSLFALPLGWALIHWGGAAWLAGGALIIFLVGIWCAEAYIAQSGVKDPGPVVVDEVAGQWLSLLPAAAHLEFWHLAAGFVLFRLFDIWKPWPVSWADRSVAGGLGVMLDDIFAGIMAAAVLYGLMAAADRLF